MTKLSALADATTVAQPTRQRRSGSLLPRRYYDIFTGVALVDIPLSTGRFATVFETSYEELTSRRLSPFWCENGNGSGRSYVRCTVPGLAKSGTVMVARLIMNAGSGAVITYLDNNPLNLRLDNLSLADGFAKGREQAAILAGPLDGAW